MKYGNTNPVWYKISLDTEQQMFYARSKAQPEKVASASTVDSALRKLAKLTNK